MFYFSIFDLHQGNIILDKSINDLHIVTTAVRACLLNKRLYLFVWLLIVTFLIAAVNHMYLDLKQTLQTL